MKIEFSTDNAAFGDGDDAARAETTRLLAELDAAWTAEILREVEDRYPRVDIAARAGISRGRLYQILDKFKETS